MSEGLAACLKPVPNPYLDLSVSPLPGRESKMRVHGNLTSGASFVQPDPSIHEGLDRQPISRLSQLGASDCSGQGQGQRRCQQSARAIKSTAGIAIKLAPSAIPMS